ncbi:Death-associated protein kinase [Paragonimus heterotremus]|uniref:Death-associated protein kinase n=1 Tax=Paragonimus heterotremus TaxID=100268 RepID=A0A8J4X316_9TREM|nr:Death-associated protein kinase [Paragonimus heterotremus]
MNFYLFIETSAYSLWDFSGYEPYFFLYDHFIGDVNCIHLVVFSLLDTPDWRRASVRFWLDFLYARIPVFEPLLSGGKPKKSACVVLVATHADCTFCPRNSSGCYENEDANELLKEIQEQYVCKLDICDTVYCLDARDATSLELKHLKSYLAQQRSRILQNLPHGNQLLSELHNEIPKWCSDETFPVDTVEQFADRIREQINPLCTDEILSTILLYLQYTGTIIYIESPSGEDLIAFNPHWLCTDALGHGFSEESMRRARITGSYTIDDFQLFVREVNTLKLVVLLEALGICVCCVVREHHRKRSKKRRSVGNCDFFQQAIRQSTMSEPVTPVRRTVSIHVALDLIQMRDQFKKEDIQIEIPRMNLINISSHVWESVTDDSSMRYSGVEISTSPGQLLHLMPRIQLHLRQSINSLINYPKWDHNSEKHEDFSTRWDLMQWLHGSKITIFNGTVEILILLHQRNQTLRLLARCIPRYTKQTFCLLHDTVHIIRSHLYNLCPALELNLNVIRVQHCTDYLETSITWHSATLINCLWNIFQQSCLNHHHMQMEYSSDDKIDTESEPVKQRCDPLTIGPDIASIDIEYLVKEQLFFGDDQIIPHALFCHVLSVNSLKPPVVRYLVKQLDPSFSTVEELERFADDLGVQIPKSEMHMFFSEPPGERDQYESATHVLLRGEASALITIEKLIWALKRLQRLDLVYYLYHAQLLFMLSYQPVEQFHI